MQASVELEAMAVASIVAGGYIRPVAHENSLVAFSKVSLS
jgi:hypothetical protein